MKRGRDGQSRQPHLGPAAAAMRRGHVFRDARASTAQVTVEQLLDDAVAMHRFHAPSTHTRRARVLIHNVEELALYRQKRRAEWEQKVKRGDRALGNWLQYARWEAAHGGDMARARAVCERAVPLHGDQATLWREYAELEQAHGQLQHARAVWARGVAAVPASADLWLKYLLCEQAAAGADAGASTRVRDVFERWLATPAGAPACVYALYALYELQQASSCSNSSSGGEDAVTRCRDVLRRYVEAHNSVEAWLLYFTVEQTVLRDAARARRVLETAQQALPDALLYGPHDYRITLALAEVYMQQPDLRERGRALYAALLARAEEQQQQQGGGGSNSNASSAALCRAYDAMADAVLAAQRRVERLYGDADGSARVCAAHARRLYTRRIERNALDMDARVSLYLLLRDELQHLQQQQQQQQQQPHDGNDDDAMTTLVDEAAVTRARDELLACLRAGMQLMPVVTRHSGDNNNDDALLTSDEVRRAQQCAAFAMAYARLCEQLADEVTTTTTTATTREDDDDDSERRRRAYVDEARRALATCIRAFPFAQGECARLWLDAAALEQRHGNVAQARKLLSAGAHVTHDRTLLQARIALEEAVMAATRQQPQQQPQQDSSSNSSRAANDVTTTTTSAQAMMRLREAYEAAVRADPHDTQWWFRFARAEEAAGQVARSRALYLACARTLDAAAARATTMTARYALLTRVDAAWARCLATQARLLRRLTLSSSSTSRRDTTDSNNDNNEQATTTTMTDEALVHAEHEMHELLAQLLQAVWIDYRHEALAWQAQQWRSSSNDTENYDDSKCGGGNNTSIATTNNSNDNSNNNSNNDDNHTQASTAAQAPAPPPTLPDDCLGLAIARWSEAVDAAVRYALPSANASATATTTTTTMLARGSELGDDDARRRRRGLLFLRSTFARMTTRERALLRRRISGVSSSSRNNDNSNNKDDDADDDGNVAMAMAALGYDATRRITAWAELLLSPLLQEWAKLEALYGGALDVVAAAAAASSPPEQQTGARRRRRLFASRS